MKRIVLAAVALLGAAAVAGQQRLTLEGCRALALENNHERAIARERSRQVDFQRAAARANFLPALSASGFYLHANIRAREEVRGEFISRFILNGLEDVAPGVQLPPDVEAVLRRLDSYLPAIPLELRVDDTYAAGVQLQQPLYAGGKARAGYRAAGIAREIAGWNEELTRATVIVASDEAYWLCVKAREMVAVAGEYRESVERFLERVEDAREVGARGRNEVLKVQVQLNEAELELLRARNARRLADMNLCRVTGLALASEIEVEGGFPGECPPAPLPGDDVERRPEYAVLSGMIALNEQQVKLARGDFLPAVGIQGTYGYVNGVKFNDRKLFDKTSFTALVSVSVPLFHWNEGQNKVRAARSEGKILELQRAEARDKMALEVTLARQALEESRLEVALTRRSLEQAGENLKVSGDQYELGMETVSDHLAAQLLHRKARASLVESLANLHLNTTRYLKAMGKL
jgi:outer membrane protein TolC